MSLEIPSELQISPLQRSILKERRQGRRPGGFRIRSCLGLFCQNHIGTFPPRYRYLSAASTKRVLLTAIQPLSCYTRRVLFVDILQQTNQLELRIATKHPSLRSNRNLLISLYLVSSTSLGLFKLPTIQQVSHFASRIMSLPTYEEAFSVIEGLVTDRKGANAFKLIGPWLDLNSLASCCRVTKQWNAIFTTHLWADPLKSTAQTSHPFSKSSLSSLPFCSKQANSNRHGGLLSLCILEPYTICEEDAILRFVLGL